MILLHRLNGSEFYINAYHIETMEQTPDTVIHLTNEKTYIVKEKIPEIVEKIIEYEKHKMQFPGHRFTQ